MDAAAYLQKQGWRGAGHSLDHTNRGIAKPLLVSKKVDVLGLGLNKHAAVSDQWWLRAFDQGLKSLGSGQESALAQAQKHGVNRGGLYARFVKGEGVAGTFGNGETKEDEKPQTQTHTQNPKWKPDDMQEPTGRKRKREDEPSEKSSKRKSEKQGRSEDERKAARLAKDKRNEERREKKVHKVEIDSTKKIAKRAARKAEEERMRAEREHEPESKTLRREARQEVKRQKAEKEAKKAEPFEKLSSKQDGFVAGAAEVRFSGTSRNYGKRNGDAAKSGEEQTKPLKPEKLAEYTKRAAVKGVSLEDYIKRRDKKAAEKRSAKGLKSLGFVADTAGVENAPTQFAGDLHDPDSLDPSLRQGKDVKSLSKDVREARRQWMKAKKTQKHASTKERRKLRAQAKQNSDGAEERRLLQAVRNATGPTVTLPSGQEYRVFRLSSQTGDFTESDKAMARRRVRHNARVEKQKLKRGEANLKGKKNSKFQQKNKEKYKKKSEVKAAKGQGRKK